jgi:hypothetical protein
LNGIAPVVTTHDQHQKCNQGSIFFGSDRQNSHGSELDFPPHPFRISRCGDRNVELKLPESHLMKSLFAVIGTVAILGLVVGLGSARQLTKTSDDPVQN